MYSWTVFFFGNDLTLASNNPLRFRKNLFNIYSNREAAKISALSSGKIYKYEYLTGEDILPSNQQQIIEQAKFNYSPLGKAFEKQIKTIEEQGEKQIKPIQDQGQVKTIKNMAMMLKMPHLSQNKKKYLMNL